MKATNYKQRIAIGLVLAVEFVVVMGAIVQST